MGTSARASRASRASGAARPCSEAEHERGDHGVRHLSYSVFKISNRCGTIFWYSANRGVFLVLT